MVNTLSKYNFKVYNERRECLKTLIKSKYSDSGGILLFFAGHENQHYKFKQNSLFYYFTGIEEPSIVLVSDFRTDQLFIPHYAEPREKWVASCIYSSNSQEILKSHNITQTHFLGNPYSGYSFSLLTDSSYYKNLVKYISDAVSHNKKIFVALDSANFFDQSLMINKLSESIPHLRENLVDVTDLVSILRRKKSKDEIALIYNAINCTAEAHEMGLSLIKPGQKEYNIQAGIDFVFANYGATQAFPSIVASGENSVILHSCNNKGELKKEDLVVVDIGAQLDYYCADLTRTYPVSGQYSKRQKDIYSIVLDTQRYVAELAQPGYWIRNNNVPEKSLHHLAHKYLSKFGLDDYFTHGIGHFLGLDVHDIGNYQEPLQEGDVITIEPGIYIKEEKLGVRIEDNYWIVKNGSICLSEDVPREVDAIEQAMASGSFK